MYAKRENGDKIWIYWPEQCKLCKEHFFKIEGKLCNKDATQKYIDYIRELDKQTKCVYGTTEFRCDYFELDEEKYKMCNYCCDAGTTKSDEDVQLEQYAKLTEELNVINEMYLHNEYFEYCRACAERNVEENDYETWAAPQRIKCPTSISDILNDPELYEKLYNEYVTECLETNKEPEEFETWFPKEQIYQYNSKL